MAYETILLEQEGPIGILKLNRPQALNALNSRVISEMISALDEVEKGILPKVLIITGAGEKAFVAGTDITEMEKLSSFEARQFANDARKAIDKVAGLDRPVIAAINGFALGGGCELAMACDIRIASEISRFGQTEILLGIIPGGGGTQRLARLVGTGKAKELIFTGNLIDAAEALRLGLLNHVCTADKLEETVMTMAGRIARQSPLALKWAKKVINAGQEVGLSRGLDYEALAECLLFTSQDREEGMKAFFEKRDPQFKGL